MTRVFDAVEGLFSVWLFRMRLLLIAISSIVPVASVLISLQPGTGAGTDHLPFAF